MESSIWIFIDFLKFPRGLIFTEGEICQTFFGLISGIYGLCTFIFYTEMDKK